MHREQHPSSQPEFALRRVLGVWDLTSLGIGGIIGGGSWGTPVVATLIPGLLMSVTAAFFSVRPLAELATLGRLLGYMLMCWGLIVLRAHNPTPPVRVRGTGTLITPLSGLALCLSLGLGLSTTT